MIYLVLTALLVAVAALVVQAGAHARELARVRALLDLAPPGTPPRGPGATTVKTRLPPGARTTLLLALTFTLAGCPVLPPVSGCDPLASRCDGDRPQVCSPSRRWHTTGDERCDATPGQTCVVRSGVAGCAR